jgi:hypothetical protein
VIAKAQSWHASERTQVISKRLARPVNAGLRDSIHDRIDWVLSARPATALESTVVGEASGPDVGIGFDPWPTDHRGVVSTFRVAPALPLPFVAPSARRVFAGDSLDVRYASGQSVKLVPAGQGPSAAVRSV